MSFLKRGLKSSGGCRLRRRDPKTREAIIPARRRVGAIVETTTVVVLGAGVLKRTIYRPRPVSDWWGGVEIQVPATIGGFIVIGLVIESACVNIYASGR